MQRFAFFVYGLFCHAMFLLVFLYMIGFVGNILVPKSIDTPGGGGVGGESLPMALAINAGLLVLFGLQHSVMARPAFKRWWTRFVPQPIERSTYVLISNLLMILLMWQWRPIGLTIWDVRNDTARAVLWTVFAAGWLLVPLVSLLINHFDLFGTRQVWLHLKGQAYTHLPLRSPGIYSRVRHPLYVGWMIAFWATPTMSLGHLLFATVNTAYMLIAIRFEERDLVKLFGKAYVDYRQQVPALIPRLTPVNLEPSAALADAVCERTEPASVAA